MSELSDEEMERIVLAGESAAVPEPAPVPEAREEHAQQETRRTIVPGVRLWIGVGGGQVIRCNVKRFHAPGSWPLPPGGALKLRGTARNGSRLEHAFDVVACSPDGAGWLLQVRTPDPSSAADVLRAFGRSA
jgi:hypothetical protein